VASKQAYLLGILASLPLDWYARRFVETHLNFFLLNPLPIPRPTEEDERRQRVIQLAGRTLTAPYLGLQPFCAWSNGRLVARVSAVINRRYISHWGQRLGQLIHFEAAAGEDDAEDFRPVIAAGRGVDLGGAAKLGRDHHQRRVEQTIAFEIADERGERLIEGRQLPAHAALDIAATDNY